jgi:hypothetical protein
MKRKIIVAMAFMIMILSLGGCCPWWYGPGGHGGYGDNNGWQGDRGGHGGHSGHGGRR